ncbi:MAG TPA: hypothetical protein VGE29_21515 [Prosthecobacter sp.]
MLTISDPSELKPADIYRQACTVASKTSRATDSHWYRMPEELAWQWHVWFDGGREVCSATYSKNSNTWKAGPPLPLASLTTGEGVSEILGELISTLYFSEKPKALGVVLHVADEFTLAEIAQASDASAESNEDYNHLRYNLVDEPREVLADRDVSTEANSWRLLPFWGASASQPRATAIALSRSREAFLQKLLACGEAARIPVRVTVTSAAVECLTALPLLKPDLQGGLLVAFSFYKFTAVFALSATGELLTARSLSHRGGASLPSGFGDILWTMAVGAELEEPRVLLLAPREEAVKAAAEELEMYSMTRHGLRVEALAYGSVPALSQVPGQRPEFLSYETSAKEPVLHAAGGIVSSTTYQSLWKGWAHQNFMDTARLDLQYPAQRDLKLLRFSSWFVYLLVFSLVATGGYGTWSLFSAMSHPSWKLTSEEMKQTQLKHGLLLEEKRQIDVTENLLRGRSKGWVTLEFLLQLFPEDSGVRVETFQYNAEAARPAPAKAGTPNAKSAGIVRTWKLKGLAKPKALELLSTLNSQRGLAALFDRVAEVTGDEMYRAAPTRQLTIALTQGRNGRFDAQAGAGQLARDPSLAFPFSFDATVTQTLSERDDLSLPLDKPF